MRFTNICLEGPDCSGKTTLYNNIQKATNFKYNIQDRSCMSMYVYSKIQERDRTSFWFDKIIDDIKRLDTLYIILLPTEETILTRLKKRGDAFQDESSILKVRNHFLNLAKLGFGSYPNVLVLEDIEDVEDKVNLSLSFIEALNEMSSSELIKSIVVNSGRNELVDVQCKEEVKISTLDYSVLHFPQEKSYYEDITQKIEQKLFREFSGLNGNNTPQKHDSRRFIYTGDSCISLIHALFRDNRLNISVTMRSSNVIKTLWADYEFLKILSFKIHSLMRLEESTPIDLTMNIRSAHIVP
jgi:thymidylate kinase